MCLPEQEADTNAQAQAGARKLMNWIPHYGVIPGQHRDRLLLLYQHLDELGLSQELEEVNYYGTTYRLSVRQKVLREAQKKKSP
jgi:transposase